MTRSTTRAAEAAFGLGIVHHVFAAKESNPNDCMDPEVRINTINKEVRGVLPPRPLSQNSYVDESNRLIIEGSLPFVYRKCPCRKTSVCICPARHNSTAPTR
jgi:hypothetical protein